MELFRQQIVETRDWKPQCDVHFVDQKFYATNKSAAKFAAGLVDHHRRCLLKMDWKCSVFVLASVNAAENVYILTY